jgi:hypothetical protein
MNLFKEYLQVESYMCFYKHVEVFNLAFKPYGTCHMIRINIFYYSKQHLSFKILCLKSCHLSRRRRTTPHVPWSIYNARNNGPAQLNNLMKLYDMCDNVESYNY